MKTKLSSSIEIAKLETDPDQITTLKKKYEKIIAVGGMSEEEKDKITLDEIKEGNVFPSTYQEEIVKCEQLLSEAFQETKECCRKIITQYPSDSSGWRRAKQNCRDKFGHIPDVAEYLDTFKSTSKKKSEIQKWAWEINSECGGKLDKVLIVLDYLLRNRLKRSEGYKISKGQKVTIGNKNFDCVIFYKDKTKMLNDLRNNGLKIGSRQLDKYTRWFLKQGIVLRTNKIGSRDNFVYCIGYWSDFKDKKGQKHENPIALYRVKAKRQHYTDAFRNFSLEK